MEEKNNNNSKPEKEKNSGFLKGVAAGMLSAVLMIAVLAGCSGCLLYTSSRPTGCARVTAALLPYI